MVKKTLLISLIFVLLTTLPAASDVSVATYTYNLQKGWNLIGVTLNPTDESAQELLVHGLYDFNGDKRVTSYFCSTEVVAGKAYWIYSETDESLVIKGTQCGDIQPEVPGTTGDFKLAIGDVTSETSGEEVTVTAPGKEGYSFTGWTVVGVSIADTGHETISFTMPANNVMLGMNYTANSYKLTTDGVDEQVNYGADISKTAPTKEGFTFTGWTITGVTVEDASAAAISFSMPACEVTLATNYTVNSYKLTTDGAEEQVNYGADISKTAPTKEGFTFTGWTITGVTVEDASAATISFSMPACEVTLTTTYEETQEGNTYLVVNLSNGSYRYTETAPDLTDDTCRTTELWLRKIPKGAFTMGSPTDEVGRYSDSDCCETQHQVTLTEDFYIGVFEMTQKQYDLVYGSNPSHYKGDTRPVESVFYNMIRGGSTGAGWPSSHDVDSWSFLGKLRAKTGLAFDLPTEAQWEYACRAGTTTALNTGKNLTNPELFSIMNEAGRYTQNKSDGKGGYSEHTKVGSYLPNDWGLYDMHGNVREWCLDWFQSDLGSKAVTDPVGATSDSCRVTRGGAWHSPAQNCRSARRLSDLPFGSYDDNGFRIVFVPSVQ